MNTQWRAIYLTEGSIGREGWYACRKTRDPSRPNVIEITTGGPFQGGEDECRQECTRLNAKLLDQPFDSTQPNRWTTDTPTVRGWYWFRRVPEAEAECVEILGPEYPTRDSELGVAVAGREDFYGITDRHFNPGVGQWYGPLEIPQ